ncbi:Anthranilate synthase component I and chorismate binding protein [metagenome]|uniref:Anthranilate synthase component I and chorismate binding protein n=1 Tax=metagenome TaxID=256318 RepID=A0A2P2BYN0_9ZZZZ
MTVEERFRALASVHERCFWLDGGGGLDWSGRRSLIGWLDDDDVSLSLVDGKVFRHAQGTSVAVGNDIFDIFDVLETEMEGDDSEVHWVGYFGYASRADLPAAVDTEDLAPTAVWMRARNVEIFDHEELPAGRRAPGPAASLSAPADYRKAFDRVQQELLAGNSYEVNLTYRVEVESGLDPIDAYLRLRELNPAPYAGFLQHGHTRLLSSSPERYATIDRNRTIETKPIKGTTPRGGTPEEDAALRDHLASDPKIRSENLMIVDLLRNDLAVVCEPGTVAVPALMEVESYESVHQLVSTVRGRLRDDVSTVAALRSLFPAGSMTGAPKLRTMHIIEDVETTSRGVYSGAFGWISGDGRADLGVVIRSLVAVPSVDGWRYRLGTGGGITVRSDVDEEYAESRWKSERLLRIFEDHPR